MYGKERIEEKKKIKMSPIMFQHFHAKNSQFNKVKVPRKGEMVACVESVGERWVS